MIMYDGIQTGVKYYWKRSDGWDWTEPDGSETRHWWEYFIEFSGFNGAGGAWLLEWHKWNSSGFEWNPQPRTLSYDETMRIVDQIRLHQSRSLASV